MNSNIIVMNRNLNVDEYAILDTLIANHHPHLVEATILLAWRRGWKPNKDRRVTLGKCQKASDLDSALAKGVDFIILLNEERWQILDNKQRYALVDHELCHAQANYNEDGERTGWRIRQHDLEEFVEIVQRHGLWKHDVATFVAVANGEPIPGQPSLFDAEEEEEDDDSELDE